MGFRRQSDLFRLLGQIKPVISRKEKEIMSNFKLPTGLNKETRDYMKDVISHLTEAGVMENVDTAALNMLARCYDTFVLASKQLETDGLTVRSDRGNISEHPLVKVRKDAITQSIKIMTEFGLTAKSRAKLPQMENADSELTPLEQFVKNNREVR